jgi:hypothetical protein
MLQVLLCFRVFISPNAPWMACKPPPDSPAPATPHTDSTCPWCLSEVTVPEVPSSDRELPWLHIIHRLPLCLAGLGRPPLFQFCSEMLLLTSDWPHYCCRLGIPLLVSTSTPQRRHPPARIPPPFTLTSSACLRIPWGMKIHQRVFQSQNKLVANWIRLQPLPASYLVCVLLSLSLSPATPSQTRTHTCSPPCTTGTATTRQYGGPPASVASILLSSPAASLQPHPRSRISCCSPQVSGAPDQVSDAMMRFLFLVCVASPPPAFCPCCCYLAC